jgi:peptide/nickel transport system substrate-binding protein
VFHLDKPNGLFLVSLARTDCGGTGILNKASVKADGTWDKPIGTGPFMFSDWVRGQYISLKKFPGYANPGGKLDGYTGSKRPLVDEVRYMFIPDQATAKAALERGDIDVLEPLDNSDAAVMRKEPGIKVAQAPVMGMTALLLQTKDPLLQNVKLRQAIAHALDYGQVAAAASDNLDQPNNSVVPRSSPYYGSVEQKGWSYDPELSKRLLTEAGYHGQELVILTNKNYPSSYDAAVVIQAMLQAVGINATLSVMEWGTQLDRYNSGKYQMMSFPYSARLDPALNYDMLTGDKATQPRKLWDNPEAIKQVQEAQIETDHAKRQALFDQLHTEFLADVPSIPLFNGLDIAAYRDDIKGYQPWVMKKPRAWEVEKIK